MQNYAIVGIVKRMEELTWAVVLQCHNRYGDRAMATDGLQNRFDTLKLLHLQAGVHRVAVYHHCSPSCRIDEDQKCVVHSQYVLEGGKYE